MEGEKRMQSRQEKLERLRPFYELQLLFAQKISELRNKPLAEALAECTTLYADIGLPYDPTPAHDAHWAAFVANVTALPNNAIRLEYITERIAQAPERHVPGVYWHGCFGYELTSDRSVQIHFRNTDASRKGPLSKKRRAARLQELREMFEEIQTNHPKITTVNGRSWLYSREEYRTLFPLSYQRNIMPIKKSSYFTGQGYWGQFVTSDGSVNSELAKQFIKNLKKLDLSNPSLVFPVKMFKTSAPIEDFFALYFK